MRFVLHAMAFIAAGALAGVALIYAALMYTRDGVFGF